MGILKKLSIFLFIFIITNLYQVIAQDETAQNITLRKGTFIKVIVLEEFSTLTSDTGDRLRFINPSDMYVYETNAVPEDTQFFGEVEDVLEPVQGRDGAIKVMITKMITPDKKVYKVKGHIYSENDNYLGGRITESVYYRKVPHYSVGLKPMLKAVPLNILEQGKHTVVKPGAELFLILDEDLKIN